MPRQPSGTLVTVAELATLIGVGPDILGLIERSGARVIDDWAGRPSLEAETAAKIFADTRTAQEQSRRRQAAYDAYLRDLETGRKSVGDSAFRETADRQQLVEYREWNSGHQTTTSTMPLSPGGLAAATEAKSEAIARFDRKNPRVPFDAFEFRG